MICPGRKVSLAAVSFDLFSADIQYRPDYFKSVFITAYIWNSIQPVCSRAPHYPEKDGLCLIVGVVGKRYGYIFSRHTPGADFLRRI